MIFLYFALAFLIGGLPFGYLVSKYLYKKDIRQLGSGNIGAANVVRSLGIKWGLLVLVLDLLKSFSAIIVFKGFLTNDSHLFLFSLFLVLGHDFSPFLNFKGGKGVATSMGVFLAIYPLVILWIVPLYLLLLFISGYPSVASLVSLLAVPVIAYFYKLPPFFIVLGLTLFLLATIRHKENLIRLFEGTENKLFPKK